MDIFVLAGQSNMAGRGNLQGLPERYQLVDDQVMCFTAKGQWDQAKEPLHLDIDLRKKHRCGAGPALICARALLNLRSDSSSQHSIGLVPCAIGGASLDEWQKAYSGVVGDCEVSSHVQTNAWGYKPGARNLFEAMALRMDEALKTAPAGSCVRGVLWYQGETDGMQEDSASTYLERFKAFVDDVRGLGYPKVSFFTVAVTGTTVRLPFLSKVRDAQIRAGSSAGIDGVWVVDAFGLPMFADGLHLVTSAHVQLGEQMALQVFGADKTVVPKGESPGNLLVYSAADKDFGGWVEGGARVSQVKADLLTITALAKAKCESKRKKISQVTKDLESLISHLNARIDGDSEATTTEALSPIPPPTPPTPKPISFETSLRGVPDLASPASTAEVTPVSFPFSSGGAADSKDEGADARTTTSFPRHDLGMPSTESTGKGEQRLDHQARDQTAVSGATVSDGASVSGREFVKSVDSEVEFESFASLLAHLNPTPEEQLMLVGCGAGTCVMASALLHRFRQVQGIDLMQGCLDEARACLSVFQENPSISSANEATSHEQSDPSLPQKGCRHATRTLPENIRLDEGDFGDGRWSDATLVYAASAYFDDTSMLGLAGHCRKLGNNARVVTLNKPLPAVESDRIVTEGEGAAGGEFEVQWQCQMRGCWGGSTVAYVHNRATSSR